MENQMETERALASEGLRFKGYGNSSLQVHGPDATPVLGERPEVGHLF